MTLYSYHSLVLTDTLLQLLLPLVYYLDRIPDKACFTHACAASFLALPNRDLSIEKQRIAPLRVLEKRSFANLTCWISCAILCFSIDKSRFGSARKEAARACVKQASSDILPEHPTPLPSNETPFFALTSAPCARLND